MTTIAFRDGVLAADTATLNGYTLLTNAVDKIVRHHGCLCGGAGRAVYLGEFQRWFLAGEFGSRPEADEDDAAIIVRPSGLIHRFEKGGWIELHPKYYSLGSGRDHAYGAFYMGATAEQAVCAAIAHEPGTGGNVTVLGLADA